MNSVPVERLRELLDYNPETGDLTWKDSRRKSPAGTLNMSGGGYIKITVDGVQTSAHRVAFALHVGRWPTSLLDHINRVPSDNRIGNLREAAHAQNHMNRGAFPSSTTGVRGVYPRRGKFASQIRTPEGRKYLGTFATVEEASKVYQEASREHYGEFAWAA